MSIVIFIRGYLYSLEINGWAVGLIYLKDRSRVKISLPLFITAFFLVDGRALAVKYKTKYIETSPGMCPKVEG